MTADAVVSIYLSLTGFETVFPAQTGVCTPSVGKGVLSSHDRNRTTSFLSLREIYSLNITQTAQKLGIYQDESYSNDIILKRF